MLHVTSFYTNFCFFKNSLNFEVSSSSPEAFCSLSSYVFSFSPLSFAFVESLANSLVVGQKLNLLPSAGLDNGDGDFFIFSK